MVASTTPPRIELLGPLRAFLDEQEVDLGPAKQRAVLAVLAANANRAVFTSTIIDAVWGEEPPENGPNVVQKYVAGLRRALEPGRSPKSATTLVTLSDGGYQLVVAPGGTDVAHFGDLVRAAEIAVTRDQRVEASRLFAAALGLWRAEALAGMPGDFFAAFRHRLAEERAAATEKWAEVDLQLGRHDWWIPRLTALADEFPQREQPRALLMTALFRSGRQTEALTVYRTFHRMLDEEFGVEPGEALQQLHRRILQADPELLAIPQGDRGQQAAPDSLAPRQLGLSMPATPDHAPAASPMSMPGHSQLENRSVLLGVLGLVIPMVTCGIGTWIMITFFAAYRRSWRIGGSAAAYLILTALFVTSITATNPDVSSYWDSALMITMMISVAGGALQGALLGFGVPKPRADPAQVHAAVAAAYRQQARLLLARYPREAVSLRIGRPDLPRAFDDGGLIDLNQVPEQVLAELAGVSWWQATRIVAHRRSVGPFFRVEDLVTLSLLPLHTVHQHLDRLVVTTPVDIPAPDRA